MGAEREDGRFEEDGGGKKREAGDGLEEAKDAEPHEYDAGLSEEERIGRSLDEISDIIHDVLSDPKGAEAGSGGEPAPGEGGGAQPQEAGTEEDDWGGDPKAAAEPAGQDAPAAGQAKSAGKGAEEVEEARTEAGGGGGGTASIEADAESKGEAGGAGAAEVEESSDGAGAAESENARDGIDRIPNPVIESILGPSEADGYGEGGRQGGRTYSYDDFIDERVLISRDAFGRKEMKIKVLEVSDEKAPTSWKLGDRVKVDKILVTVKHLETQQVEEGEFDIEAIEKEIARDRHYSSTNRWVPTTDIKNGYVAGSRHTSLISDAVALEYIIF